MVFGGVAHDESEQLYFRPRLTVRIAPRLRTDEIKHVAPTAIGDGGGRQGTPYDKVEVNATASQLRKK